MTTCPICDFTFEESFGPDAHQHNSRCRKVAALQEKFGELWNHNDREAAKAEGWAKVLDESLPLDGRMRGAEQSLWEWFSRSVLNAMNMKHPDFPEYVSMILNQDHARKLFPEPVLTALIERYGQRTGIGNGKTYWQPPSKQKRHLA